MKNTYTFLISCLVAIFAIAWTFNHINAWIGIGLGIVLSYYLISQFKSFIK